MFFNILAGVIWGGVFLGLVLKSNSIADNCGKPPPWSEQAFYVVAAPAFIGVAIVAPVEMHNRMRENICGKGDKK